MVRGTLGTGNELIGIALFFFWLCDQERMVIGIHKAVKSKKILQ